jgi:cytochrome c peroxidase
MPHQPLKLPLFMLALLGLSACADVRSPTDTPEAARFARAPADAILAALGKAIYEDQNLSLNRNQSCATCHAADWGFKGSNDPNIAGMYQGSVAGQFGARTPPSAAYATQAPVFGWRRGAEGLYIGGNFWDGRATGARLGSPAAEQALGPFLNPVEQAFPDLACVVYRVANASYGDQYRAVWGNDVDAISFPAGTDAACSDPATTAIALSSADRDRAAAEYDRIGYAVAAFEASPEVNAFSSRFDEARRGKAKLSAEEQLGLKLFNGKAQCAACHPSHGKEPVFTDYSFDNLGTPANPENPVYAVDPGFVDLGLGGPGGAAPGEEQWGLMRVPTLRNVGKGADKRYMHNGVFTSLLEVVHFYNTRDALPACASGAPRTAWGESCWPEPEVAENVNDDELGDLGLTAEEEAAIVAFLLTLSDR